MIKTYIKDTITREVLERGDGRDSLTFIDLFVVAVETWTKYIAMDSDGVVYGYDEKPRLGDHRWFGDGSNSIYLGTVDVGGLDWKCTLLEVGASGARRAALDLEEKRKRG